MAIRKSASGGTPFGSSENRPSNPSIGQTFYNGTLGYLEIYTDSGWIPASGGNDFNLNITGTYSSVTFTQSYASGAYSVVSNSNDATIDIYAYATDGTLAGYTNTKSFIATKRFNKVVIIGGTNGDVLGFSYKNTYATSYSDSETSAPAWITSISQASLPNINDTTVVTGGNFASDVQVYFTGTDAVVRTAKSIVRSSSTSLIVTRPDNLPVSASPYTLRVVNQSVVNQPTGTNLHILSNAVTAGQGPAWVTSTLPDFINTVSYSTSLSATDADSTNTFSLVSGSLPTGISLSSSGVLSGVPTVSGSYTFTVRATDGGGNYVDRSFTMTQTVPNPATITSSTDVGTNRPFNNGAASIAFSAPAYTGTSSITSYTVTASTGQTASGSSSPIVVTGIATGATPTFTVVATNSSGNSLSSIAGSIVTITTVPATPTIGTATRTNNTTVSVGFTAPASGGKSITSYAISSSPSVSITASGSSSPVTGTGSFTPGVNYSFSVAAVNANGTSSYSGASNSLLMAFPTVSGGSLTSDATYYYRTFTGSSSISTDGPITADVLVVAGGGGAGGGGSRRYFSGTTGGCGGAGGTRTVSVTIPAGSTAITVGGGGSGSTYTGTTSNGGDSGISGLVNNSGGGRGATSGIVSGSSGGSGGGGFYDGYYKGPSSFGGSSGISGQGNSGASGTAGGAGGGGAASAGSSTTGGAATSIFGYTVGAGGSGNNQVSGASNTGNGGGTASTNGTTGGNGGSGLVVVRYTRSQVGG